MKKIKMRNSSKLPINCRFDLSSMDLSILATVIIGMLSLAFLTGTGLVYAADQGTTQKIYVAKIVVSDSEILTAAEIDTIVSKYEGQELGIEDLQVVTAELNQLYLDKGFITARAILPPQTVEAGEILIELIEGRVGELHVVENVFTNASYILNRIGLTKGDLFQLDRLEQELAYFNLVNDVQLIAELQAGQEFGTTDIILTAFEPPNQQVALSMNNWGRIETGENQYGVTLLTRSLLGHRDSLTLSGFITKGSFSGTVSYKLPAAKDGAYMQLSYYRSDGRVVQGEHDSLEINSLSGVWNLKFSRPVIIDAGNRSETYFELQRQKSRTRFSGAELLKSTINKATVGFDIQIVKPDRFWYTSHKVAFGYEDNNAGLNSFLKFSGYYFLQQAFADHGLLEVSIAAQYAPTSQIPSSEQFSIGGASTLRGYSSGARSGDNGYSVSIELKEPETKQIRSFAYFDHGAAFSFLGENQSVTAEDFISSVGVGIDLKPIDAFYDKFVVGVPLDFTDIKLHLSIQATY